jgi:hypothetical protein
MAPTRLAMAPTRLAEAPVQTKKKFPIPIPALILAGVAIIAIGAGSLAYYLRREPAAPPPPPQVAEQQPTVAPAPVASAPEPLAPLLPTSAPVLVAQAPAVKTVVSKPTAPPVAAAPVQVQVQAPTPTPLPVVAAPAPVTTAAPVAPRNLHQVHKLFIANMEDQLDDFIRQEIGVQLGGRLTIVTHRANADAILSGHGSKRGGLGSKVSLGFKAGYSATVTIGRSRRQPPGSGCGEAWRTAPGGRTAGGNAQGSSGRPAVIESQR